MSFTGQFLTEGNFKSIFSHCPSILRCVSNRSWTDRWFDQMECLNQRKLTIINGQFLPWPPWLPPQLPPWPPWLPPEPWFPEKCRSCAWDSLLNYSWLKKACIWFLLFIHPEFEQISNDRPVVKSTAWHILWNLSSSDRCRSLICPDGTLKLTNITLTTLATSPTATLPATLPALISWKMSTYLKWN